MHSTQLTFASSFNLVCSTVDASALYRLGCCSHLLALLNYPVIHANISSVVAGPCSECYLHAKVSSHHRKHTNMTPALTLKPTRHVRASNTVVAIHRSAYLLCIFILQYDRVVTLTNSVHLTCQQNRGELCNVATRKPERQARQA